MGVFEKILHDGISRGHLPAKTTSAREWYRNVARDFSGRIRGDQSRVDYGRSKALNKRLVREYTADRGKEIIKPGSMYMYYYDPKYKEELPYYDKFPLIFPFRVQADRFWGINLHYLPLPMRAKLMDALYDLSRDKRYDENTRLNISWELLNASSKTKFVKPCVKQYLISHTRSKFLFVKPEEWDVALFLPTEAFEKKTKSQVWSESKKSLGVTK